MVLAPRDPGERGVRGSLIDSGGSSLYHARLRLGDRLPSLNDNYPDSSQNRGSPDPQMRGFSHAYHDKVFPSHPMTSGGYAIKPLLSRVNGPMGPRGMVSVLAPTPMLPASYPTLRQTRTWGIETGFGSSLWCRSGCDGAKRGEVCAIWSTACVPPEYTRLGALFPVRIVRGKRASRRLVVWMTALGPPMAASK